MASRGAAALSNAILWGTGYLYSRRGYGGIFAVLAHLLVYTWAYLLGVDAILLWGPILLLGTLYFAIDGYKYASPMRAESQDKPRKAVCKNCGHKLSGSPKFCPECGASQTGD